MKVRVPTEWRDEIKVSCLLALLLFPVSFGFSSCNSVCHLCLLVLLQSCWFLIFGWFLCGWVLIRHLAGHSFVVFPICHLAAFSFVIWLGCRLQSGRFLMCNLLASRLQSGWFLICMQPGWFLICNLAGFSHVVWLGSHLCSVLHVWSGF